MKTINKTSRKTNISYLLVFLLSVIPLSSFKNASGSNHLSLLESKYHLKHVSGITNKKFRNFNTIQELESYLSKHNRGAVSFKAKSKTVLTTTPFSATAADAEIYSGYDAQMDFPDITGIGFTSTMSIQWQMTSWGDLDLTSNYTLSGLDGDLYSYAQTDASQTGYGPWTSSNVDLTVNGAYNEYYGVQGNIDYEIDYDFQFTGEWNRTTWYLTSPTVTLTVKS
jgi:hypothetical protein